MAADTNTLQAMAEKNAKGLDLVTKNVEVLGKSLEALTKKLATTPANGSSNQEKVYGTPWARTGENVMTSRGFSFMKMIGVLTNSVERDNAKIECDVSERLHKAYGSDYAWGGMGRTGETRFLAPLATSYMDMDRVDNSFRAEMKALVGAGMEGVDYGEMKHIRMQQYKNLGYSAKTLSWLNEQLGGALVAPPEMGELIELLRNKEALVNAGARTVPLPPQGRMKFPRQTAASSTYWVGENAPIPASDIGTGEVTLQAKKLAVLIRAPNELIRFASPAAEALMRDDMTKSLALGLDLAGLEGLGGDTRPRGVLNLPGINRVNSSSQTANGDAVKGQDIYRCIAIIEESNSEFEGWIMRPKSLYKYYQLRADAVGQGDSSGMFLFNLVREAGDGVQALLGGYPVTKSTQVSQVRSKGTASNLTYVVGGMWSDFLIGMFGAIEFAATTLGDTAFINDQTWVRGILSADCAARHDISFMLLDNLDLSL